MEKATLKNQSFASTLKNKIDFNRLYKILIGRKACTILENYDPDGREDGGEWKVSGWEGGYGNSLCFSLQTGIFKDFGDSSPGGKGLVSYLSRRWKIDLDSVINKLIQDKWLDAKDAYGVSKASVRKQEYGSLVIPAPEEEDVEESIKPSQRNLIQGKWAYRDLDGSLLGWVIRFEEPGGVKKTPPFTYWSKGGWQRTDWGGRWPLFGLEKLQEKGTGAKIVIVEGEKTAEIASKLLPACVVLGFGGVNKAEKIELSYLSKIINKREIIVWPDNDRVGIKAAKKLCWRLIKELGCDNISRVNVESIKAIENKDSWDLADWTEDCGVSIMSEIENAEDQNSIEAHVKNSIYVARLKRFFSAQPMKDGSFGYDKESFRDLHAHINPKLDTELLQDSRLVKLDNITFWPGQDRVVNEDGQLKLNTWAPDGFLAELEEVNYAEQGLVWDSEVALEKTKYFREHLDYIFPDETARDIFMSYLKFLIENPGEKVLWTPLIQGEEGTGKSYFGDLLRKLLGINNVSVVQNEQIKGEHTGWVANTTVAIVEELSSGGKREFTDKLKPLITNNTVQIREKYLPDVEIRNRVNFLMFTNRKDSLLLDPNDRRFFVYYSPPHRKEPSYYQALFNEMEENIWWLYHHFLYNVEYTKDINFKGPAPSTASKLQMINQSLREIDAELMELEELGIGCFRKDIVSGEEVRALTVERGYSSYSSQAVGRAMSRLGWEVVGRHRKTGSSERIKLRSVRNHEKWLTATEEAIREEYETPREDLTGNVVGMPKRKETF